MGYVLALSRQGWRIAAMVAAVGLAVRLVLAFALQGHGFDMESFRQVRDQLGSDPLHIYSTLRVDARWPYPPLYFLWIAPAGWLAQHTGLPFHALVHMPPMAADLAIAYLVQMMLAWRGATERTRLAAFALVMLGPSFIEVSGYGGQSDSAAFVWAVAALAVWERGGEHRALTAGLLLGVGAAVKTMPLLMVLALIPTARSRREAFTLGECAVGVLAGSLAMFAVADPGGLGALRDYQGKVGAGGLALVLQPDLASLIRDQALGNISNVTEFLMRNSSLINLLWLGGIGLFLLRKRVPAVEASVLLWLTFYVFATGFFFQYLVWGLPFLLIAGRVRLVVAIQALVLVAVTISDLQPVHGDLLVGAYAALMIAMWALLTGALTRGVLAASRPRRREPRGLWVRA